MRKLSFPSLCFIAMLCLSSCTKEDVQQNPTTTNPVVDNPQNNYSTVYSGWTTDGQLTWNEAGTASEPSRASDWFAPLLTQERIDAGALVLVYVKSDIDGAVQSMPWNDGALNNEKVNSYQAVTTPGSIVVHQSTTRNGVMKFPETSNNVSFRYIIVGPQVPGANAREITTSELSSMPYADVVEALGIPE